MYISPEDARSDVILAGATTLVGGFAVQLVTRLPVYPQRGVLPLLLDAGWSFALTGLVPLLLARYRGHGAAAFGLDRGRTGWRSGLGVALPVAVLGALFMLDRGGSALSVFLGRLGGPIGAGNLGFVAVAVAQLAAFTVGALLLTTFLTVRGRDAFRTSEVSQTELLRTFGMGAALAGLAIGLLRSLGAAQLVPTLLPVLALAAMVLIADRLVTHGAVAPRTAVLTPVVVTVVLHVFAAGGLFRGDLVTGLYAGALAAGTVAVVAVLIETRWRAWAVVPLMVALHWWPTCLSPLAFELFVC